MREKVLSTIKKLIFMFLIMLCVVSQSTSTQCKTVLNKKQTESYLQKISKYEMSTIQNPQYGSIGGEWLMIGLARFERVPSSYVEIYLNNLKEYVKKCDGVLSTRKYTEYSRVVLALTSLGIDPENFEGYNLLKSLAEFDNVNKLGINGPTYALIALDSGDYAIPEPAKSYDGKVTTREKLVGLLVNAQNDDGGWSYMGGKSDVDVTAMAMQALANYKKQSKVEKALEKGIEYLSKKQNKTGAYSTSNSENCESTAQVLTALSEMRIKIDDSRFVKNGKNVYDGLMTFYKDNGAFCHTKGKGANQMSTDQAMYAITAYYRSISGMNRLYDMSDGIIKIENTKVETTKADNKEETKSSASDKNKNDANNNDKNNSTSKNTKRNASSNSKNNSKSNGNTLNNSDDNDNRENNESKNRKDNNVETEENTNTTDSLENATDVLENNDEENKIAIDNNIEQTENKENKISANNKENVTKETKHKNRRPYIILIFGICCGIAGKFGFDIYKYKKKRVTNKDEQN